MIFTIGSTIVRGKYQIMDFLGQGGFGEVFKAFDTQLEREVAIKVIQKGPGSSSDEYHDYEERFKQEAKIGANVRDDNVIAVYGLEQEEDKLVLVTEFAAGGSLAKKILKAALSPAEVLELGAQLCKGVAAIQRPPVSGVHRDIKPSNILFDDLGRAKVADLGLVQISGMSGRSMDFAGKHPGSPGYMSPEQERETSYLRPASDVYAIGCVLFEALTQKMYQSLPAGTKLGSLVENVPPELEAVVEKALAQEVDQRYVDAEAMMKALQAVKAKTVPAVGTAASQAAGIPAVPVADPTVITFQNGAQARTPEQWVKLADLRPEEAAAQLGRGAVEQWLVALQRLDLAAKVSEIRQREKEGPVALELVQQGLDAGLAAPALSVEKGMLDFGTMRHGERKSLRLNLSNASRGLLFGSVKTSAEWLKVGREQVRCRAGQTLLLEVSLDAGLLRDGEYHQPAALAIETNGGSAELDVQVTVLWEPELAATPGALNFGELKAGQEESLPHLSLTLRNKGGGTLHGTLSSPADWLALAPASFALESGQEVGVQVVADPQQLPGLGVFRTQVDLATEGGLQSIPVSLSYIMEGLEAKERWKSWAIYLGGMAGVLLAWAVPLAFALAWLLGRLPTPPLWQWIGMGVLPVLAWIAAAILPRRFGEKLDKIETFYHQGSLAEEIHGTTGAILPRLVFGMAAGGLAALSAWQNGMGSFYIQPLRQAFPLIALAAAAGFFFAFVLLSPRPEGMALSRGQRLWAGPRAVFLGLLAGLLCFAIQPAVASWWTLAWPVALGMALGGSRFSSHPQREHWMYDGVLPAAPGAVLLGLFFAWGKLALLKPGVDSIWTYYAVGHQEYLLPWNSLLFGVLVLALGGLGLWLNTSREAGFKEKLSATSAALLFGGVAALVGYFLHGLLQRVLLIVSGNFSGGFGLVLVLLLAGLVLWAMSSPQRWLKRSSDWFVGKLGAVFARIPGLARQAAQAVKDSSAKAGINPGLEGSGLADAAGKAGDLIKQAGWRARRARGAAAGGLSEYLTGEAVLPLSAQVTALVILTFLTPAVFRLLALLLGLVLGVGKTLLVLLLCVGVPLLLVFFGYRVWKKRQGG